MNRNRNRFAEPNSVQIGSGIVCDFKNLNIGIGIVPVRDVFANNSQIPEVSFSFLFSPHYFYTFFIWKNLPGKHNYSVIF